MSAQSPELQSQIAIWRARAADGSLTLPEMKEAIKLLRDGRVTAGQAAVSAKSRAKAKAEIKPADDLLSELGGL